MANILDGIRVLDFGRYASAPVASMMLADMGAEVIRVEKPGGEDDRRLAPFAPNGMGFLFMNSSRNKKCITLNLRNEASLEILDRLVKKADVVIHNYAPGTKQCKLLEYERLQEINSGIILAAVSGFGQSGPYAKRPGFDSVAQAMCGAMSITGFPGNPPTRAQGTWVDTLTATHCALGIMSALYERTKTGLGQMIDVSLLDSAVFGFGVRGLTSYCHMNQEVEHYQLGNNSWYLAPGNLYKTKDGWVMLTAASYQLWKRMAKIMGMPELADDPKYSSIHRCFENRDELNIIIENWTKERTEKEVLDAMLKAHVPAGSVYSMQQVINDEHVKAREMFVEVDYSGGKALLCGFPINFSRTPGAATGPVAEVGENNKDVYHDVLDMGAEEISQLKEKNII